MNINKFTQKSLQAVQDCEKTAMEYGNQEIEQEHLLYALLTQDDSLILKMMEKMGLDKNLVIDRVEQAILINAYNHFFHVEEGIDKKIVINNAVELAKNYLEEKDYRFVNAILDNILVRA